MTSRGGRLILVRHGESAANVARVLDTRLPGFPLTPRGMAQAQSFAAGLARAPRVVFSSAALRAQQTAQTIGSVTGVPAEVLDGMHEVQVGDLEGLDSPQAYKTFTRIYDAWHRGELNVRMPGGETGQEVLDRYLPVLEQLRRDWLAPARETAARETAATAGEGVAGDTAAGDIVVVGHGAAIRLVSQVIGQVAPAFSATSHLDNAESIDFIGNYYAGEFQGWQCLCWGRHSPPFSAEHSGGTDDPMG